MQTWTATSVAIATFTFLYFGGGFCDAQAHPYCDVPEEMFRPENIFPGDLWPGGIVKYELDSTLTPNDLIEVQRAFDDYHSKTCIRFQERSPNELNFTKIQRHPEACGVSELCRKGGEQYTMIGGDCGNVTVIIHELGHTLCLGHEATRGDRDDYLHFDTCPPNEVIPPRHLETRGHLFDYASVMHYPCGMCLTGWPKMDGVPGCGPEVDELLSVLDADKINDFYDCQGCLGHRWRATNNFTEADRQGLIQFGETNEGQPLYLCRGYVGGGEVAPGKYRLDQDLCYVSYNGTVHQINHRVQVFTLPLSKGKEHDTPNYQTYTSHQLNPNQDNLVPVGRTARAVPIYAAVATVEVDGATETAVGKVYANDMARAYIPFLTRELVVTEFEIIGCDV